ncbi:hypothetical protein NSK_008732 [Nannochloropsis salina CCMP1776]|uniref:Fe2OG dioxygenase domain-containing protein n=1 Tax=Nannochloropsis salina CCMP1776 TaxID=1027361 RepID=A0A4D9CN36_9STRA|nr:hypothetical protein NSK_008732 [Nannochloropsis salina CCMP1776]|eukprot:TFJ79924.1 hypothetical protein NSK_008732 [Nannochloropsis salina CCMP1776]
MPGISAKSRAGWRSWQLGIKGTVCRLSSSSSTTTIPVIDLSPFVDPHASESSKTQCAEAVHHAAVNVGFLYVKNHGVDPSIMDGALAHARAFFSLPQVVKEEISILNQYQAPSNKEGTTPPLSCRGYQKAMCGLGNRLMRAFSLGFGLPENYFAPFYHRSFWCLRLIRYPPVSPQERESLSSGLGCGEHSDYGCLTLLNMDESTQALQARNTQGAWIFADPIPGTLLVNIGDMLSRWSNGKFKSTPHRVLPAVGKARISIPFFFEPNLDTLVVPLPECENYARAHGKIYSSVLFADHLRSKVTNNFSFLEPSPTATSLTGSKVHTVDGKGSERH